MDNYFGGASQFAGGGFMPSPAAGTDNAYGGAGGAKRSGQAGKREETIRMVSIKQILHDAQPFEDDHDRFTLDGHPLANVCVLGRILDVQERAQKVDYKITDGTGELDVVMHMPADGEEWYNQRKRELQPNTYVKVYGSLRRPVHTGILGLTSYNIRAIQDFNEVAYHNLQIIFQHLHLTRGAPRPGAVGAPAGGPTAYGAPVQGGAGYANAPAGGVVAVGVGGGAPPGSMVKTGNIQQDILNVFNNPAAAVGNGWHVSVVEQELKNQGMHYATHQIKETLDFLVNDGVLYTTLDENHFKSCSSG